MEAFSIAFTIPSVLSTAFEEAAAESLMVEKLFSSARIFDMTLFMLPGDLRKLVVYFINNSVRALLGFEGDKSLISYFGERICHLPEQICRGFNLALRNYLHLAEGCYVIVLVNAKLVGYLAEFILVRLLGEHLTADEGADVLSVHDYWSGKIHKSAGAVIYGWLSCSAGFLAALQVALIAAFCANVGFACELHAEVSEITSLGNGAVFIGCQRSHSCSGGKCVLQVLECTPVDYIKQSDIIKIHVDFSFLETDNRGYCPYTTLAQLHYT